MGCYDWDMLHLFPAPVSFQSCYSLASAPGAWHCFHRFPRPLLLFFCPKFGGGAYCQEWHKDLYGVHCALISRQFMGLFVWTLTQPLSSKRALNFFVKDCLCLFLHLPDALLMCALACFVYYVVYKYFVPFSLELLIISEQKSRFFTFFTKPERKKWKSFKVLGGLEFRHTLAAYIFGCLQ